MEQRKRTKKKFRYPMMKCRSNPNNHFTFAQISVKDSIITICVRYEKTKDNNKYHTILRENL